MRTIQMLRKWWDRIESRSALLLGRSNERLEKGVKFPPKRSSRRTLLWPRMATLRLESNRLAASFGFADTLTAADMPSDRVRPPSE
jgi:hypothetical protein